MKSLRKFLFAGLLSVFFLIGIPNLVLSAGTITCVDTTYDGLSREKEIRFVIYTVTFDSGAASPANISLDTIPGVSKGSLGGWWLLRVEYMFGGTGPTDDTDLYLWRSYGVDKIDILGGNGVDFIDNATNNVIYPVTTSQPLTGGEIFDIDNNSVNDAVGTIVFTLYR